MVEFAARLVASRRYTFPVSPDVLLKSEAMHELP
jgi:hypothetical protein